MSLVYRTKHATTRQVAANCFERTQLTVRCWWTNPRLISALATICHCWSAGPDNVVYLFHCLLNFTLIYTTRLTGRKKQINFLLSFSFARNRANPSLGHLCSCTIWIAVIWKWRYGIVHYISLILILIKSNLKTVWHSYTSSSFRQRLVQSDFILSFWRKVPFKTHRIFAHCFALFINTNKQTNKKKPIKTITAFIS